MVGTGFPCRKLSCSDRENSIYNSTCLGCFGVILHALYSSCPKAKAEPELVPSEPSIRSAEAVRLCWCRVVVTASGHAHPSQHTVVQISIHAHPSSQRKLPTAQLSAAMQASPRLPIERSSEHADEAFILYRKLFRLSRSTRVSGRPLSSVGVRPANDAVLH